MAKYLDSTALAEMNQARLQIFAIRAEIYRNYQVDVLDTDALSALSIHEIVSQYDSDYNINFSRNGGLSTLALICAGTSSRHRYWAP